MSVWNEAESLREAVMLLQISQYRAREDQYRKSNTPKAVAWTAKALAAGDGEAQKLADANKNNPPPSKET